VEGEQPVEVREFRRAACVCQSEQPFATSRPLPVSAHRSELHYLVQRSQRGGEVVESRDAAAATRLELVGHLSSRVAADDSRSALVSAKVAQPPPDRIVELADRLVAGALGRSAERGGFLDL
jgi:hypothetical protein